MKLKKIKKTKNKKRLIKRRRTTDERKKINERTTDLNLVDPTRISR
jgi:hypothetical protein